MSRRKAKEATPQYLERVAIWYLERYPGSIERVRQTLMKRVRRSVRELETDPAQGAAAIEEVLTKLIRLDYLDDARFAQNRVRSLRRRGKSTRAIQAALRRQGIDAATVDDAMCDDAPDIDLEAARDHVRRKRLGWRRAPEKREAMKQKDLARLARAGFSYSHAIEALREPEEDAREEPRW